MSNCGFPSVFFIHIKIKDEKNQFNYSTSSYLNSLYFLEKVKGLINKQIQLNQEHTKQQEMQT